MAKLPAGARKRADGSLEKRFSVNGKRYSVYGKNAKELQQKETELRKEIESGNYTSNKNLTLDDYFKTWIEGKKASVKSNTIYIYTKNFKGYISPAMGKCKIVKIERRQILEFQPKSREILTQKNKQPALILAMKSAGCFLIYELFSVTCSLEISSPIFSIKSLSRFVVSVRHTTVSFPSDISVVITASNQCSISWIAFL